jgi:hypothetical protein
MLLVAGMIVAARIAEARRVRVDPPIQRECPSGKTWLEVEQCLARLGKPTVLHAADHAKVVAVDHELPTEVGLGLYVERSHGWQLWGHFAGRNTGYQVLGLEKLTIAGHTAYRLDIGQLVSITRMPSFDPLTAAWDMLRIERSMYCAGFDVRCADVVTDCELFVRRRVAYMFHGRVEIAIVDGSAVARLRADATRGGFHCTPQITVPLPLPF